MVINLPLFFKHTTAADDDDDNRIAFSAIYVPER